LYKRQNKNKIKQIDPQKVQHKKKTWLFIWKILFLTSTL